MSGRKRAATSIRLRGFAQQRVVTVDEVVSLLEGLPPAHLEGLAEIVYDPTRFEQRLDAYHAAAPGRRPDLRCAGEYVRGRDRIALYECRERAQFVHLLLHELGHHAFHRGIDGTTRKKWVTVVHPGPGEISDYARRNANEAFAEGYAAFVLDTDRLRSIPAKHRFFASQVFGSGRMSPGL